MRLALTSDHLVEWLALRLGLVPTPAAEAWAGMALSGVLVAATRVGLTARLARTPVTTAQASHELGLDLTATQLLLDCLQSVGHVTCRAGQYRLSRSARRWLDPDSRLSVARFVAGNCDYWQWWSSLPEVLQTGTPASHHDAGPDDPYWDRYIHGQHELARLSAAEVARRLRVPAGSTSVLDIGGGHGWYCAELCLRHPQLQATVLDLPGGARVGRQIIAAAGLADRVQHRDGNALDADLGSGYDIVLCFNLVHHLTPAQIVDLFTRVHSALAPGGSMAVLDAFAPRSRRISPSAATLGMFMYLSSGTRCYAIADLHLWLAQAGFDAPQRIPVRRIPGLALYQARA
jgi:SAM-dependent methyltransferase